MTGSTLLSGEPVSKDNINTPALTPDESLCQLLSARQWDAAALRVAQHPEEAKEIPENTSSATPLALACRYGAPYSCVKVILEANPLQVRHSVAARGTPLHEAMICEELGVDVIDLLLKADESLENDHRIDDETSTISKTRAALMQDVDGHTPLHLLIRRRFQSPYRNSQEEQDHLMEMLRLLVQSCAEAVSVPDRGEFEEPPLVMALKRDTYAPFPESESSDMERRIYEMVDCMLQHCPQAASLCLTGARGNYTGKQHDAMKLTRRKVENVGGYGACESLELTLLSYIILFTALHSAVFHGRCPSTISLLLNAEAQQTDQQQHDDYANNRHALAAPPCAALLANTQGELPLHFCAMRGEPPRSIALLAEAAPQAAILRDASGLTPLHWLWVRFASTLLALDDDNNNTRDAIAAPLLPLNWEEQDDFDAFTRLERGDFDYDLQLVRRVDPPVDFLRMRHIPSELLDEEIAEELVEQTVLALENIRAQQLRLAELQKEGEDAEDVQLTRPEAVQCFFWSKVVSLLRAAVAAAAQEENAIQYHSDGTEFRLAHTAFASASCPPPVAKLVGSLFTKEMSVRDTKGRLPLHCAAKRDWTAYDWPRERGQDQLSESPAVRLLEGETLDVLHIAMELSPLQAAHVADEENRLPLHHAIESFVRACSRTGRTYQETPVRDMLETLRSLVQMYPDSLERRDGKSKLFPFLQASAAATESRSPPTNSDGFPVSFPDEMPLSIVYLLLRENPSLIRTELDACE